jgi:hypothetical protein
MSSCSQKSDGDDQIFWSKAELKVHQFGLEPNDHNSKRLCLLKCEVLKWLEDVLRCFNIDQIDARWVKMQEVVYRRSKLIKVAKLFGPASWLKPVSRCWFNPEAPKSNMASGVKVVGGTEGGGTGSILKRLYDPIGKRCSPS